MRDEKELSDTFSGALGRATEVDFGSEHPSRRTGQENWLDSLDIGPALVASSGVTLHHLTSDVALMAPHREAVHTTLHPVSENMDIALQASTAFWENEHDADVMEMNLFNRDRVSVADDADDDDAFCEEEAGLRCYEYSDKQYAYEERKLPDEAKRDWSEMSDDYAEERSLVVEAVVVPALRKFLSEVGEGAVGINFGPGPGNLDEEFLKANVFRLYGPDISPEMIEANKRNIDRLADRYDHVADRLLPFVVSSDPYDLRKADLEHPISDGSLDFAAICSVLMTLDSTVNIWNVMDAMRPKLKPGAPVFITSINTNVLGSLSPVTKWQLGAPNISMLDKYLEPLAHALDEFRLNGTPLEPGSVQWRMLQQYGQHALLRGEWATLPYGDKSTPGFGGSRDPGKINIVRGQLYGPQPKETGQPFVVMANWKGNIHVFRDRYYTPFDLYSQISGAGYEVVATNMESPLPGMTQFPLAYKFEDQGEGPLLIIQATKPIDSITLVGTTEERPVSLTETDVEADWFSHTSSSDTILTMDRPTGSYSRVCELSDDEDWYRN